MHSRHEHACTQSIVAVAPAQLATAFLTTVPLCSRRGALTEAVHTAAGEVAQIVHACAHSALRSYNLREKREEELCSLPVSYNFSADMDFAFFLTPSNLVCCGERFVFVEFLRLNPFGETNTFSFNFKPSKFVGA